MIDVTNRHDIITIDRLREWGACWFEEADDDDANLIGEGRLLDASGGRSSLSCREICALPQVSHADKMWVLTHALWRRDRWLCYDFAIWCAERALEHLTPEWRAKIAPVTERCKGLCEKPAAAACAAYAAYAAYAAAAANAAAYARAAAAAAARAAAYDAAAANAAAAAERSAQIEHALGLLEAP